MMHKHEINSMLSKADADAAAAEEEKKALVEVRLSSPPPPAAAAAAAAVAAAAVHCTRRPCWPDLPWCCNTPLWATACLPARDGGTRLVIKADRRVAG
jgi:hypothetical protein